MTHGGRLFAIAQARGWDWRDMEDFSASINPLGPSPKALEAIRASIDQIGHYPESHPQALLQAISETWDVDPETILVGNGATDLIHFLGAIYRDSKVTLHPPVFSEFHRVFPSATLGEYEQSRHLTVITRPMNPTGELPQIEEWLAATSHPVIVDESFIEFAGVPSVTDQIGKRPNLKVLRSLTKFHGIPGLRIGVLLTDPDTIRRWKALRDPWSVNVVAIQAACASLRDVEHSHKTLALVREERAWLSTQLSSLNQVEVCPSAANYLFVKLRYSSGALTSFLEDRKLLIRDCSGWPGLAIENAVRVAVRTRAENERLISSWREFPCQS